MTDQTESPTSIRFPADLKAELQKRADAEDRTFTSYVIHALRQHLSRERGEAGTKAKSRK